MPRQRRMTWTHYPHLVIAKANGGLRLFYDTVDYVAYLDHLRQMVRDKILLLYAYCLKDDEIRLVLKPTRLSLSRIMQRLHGSHTARMNRRLGRHGYLFLGRFRSIVFPDEDLVQVVRSVHLWPIRVGLTHRIEAYPWSSHNAYILPDDPWVDLIDNQAVLDNFSLSPKIAQRAFLRFVESAALDPDDFGVSELIPGIGARDGRVAELLQKANHQPQKGPRPQSLRVLAQRVALLLNVHPALLAGRSRRQDLVVARRLLSTVAVLGGNRTITEVAEFLQRDKAQVSRLVSQGMDLIHVDEPFRTLYESVRGRQVITQPTDRFLLAVPPIDFKAWPQ